MYKTSWRSKCDNIGICSILKQQKKSLHYANTSFEKHEPFTGTYLHGGGCPKAVHAIRYTANWQTIAWPKLQICSSMGSSANLHVGWTFECIWTLLYGHHP